MTSWEIIETIEYSDWFDGLDFRQQLSIRERTRALEAEGPMAGRPSVDTLSGSRIRNLKELRVSSGGAIRILFVFDPRRRAVLLLGGDKSEGGMWNRWYPGAIRQAERIYERHLREME